MGITGGRRYLPHAPVDANDLPRSQVRLSLGLNDERGMPVPDRVSVHPDRTRHRRQRPRPHHAQRDPAGQGQLPVAEVETLPRVVHGRRHPVSLAELGPTGLRPASTRNNRGAGRSRDQSEDAIQAAPFAREAKPSLLRMLRTWLEEGHAAGKIVISPVGSHAGRYSTIVDYSHVLMTVSSVICPCSHSLDRWRSSEGIRR
jgi:hypothetical protein